MLIRTTILALVFGAYLQSCGDVTTECEPIATTGAAVTKASLSSIQSTVFDKQCATSGCHVTNGAEPLLTKDNSYTAMVNVPALNNGILSIVKPGDPTQSYLLVKLMNSDNTGLMPKGGSKLPQNVIDSISAWITKGAPND